MILVHPLTITDTESESMNPFRCSSTSSDPKNKKQDHRKATVKEPKGRRMLVQQFIKIHPGGREEILDTWVHRDIPQDLTCDNVATSIRLNDGTTLTTSEDLMEQQISRYMSLISKLF